jgi:hypothetical protein
MKYIYLLATLFTVVMLNITPVNAEVPSPTIPKGEGEKCVEPTDVMRRNHMKFILHQRDKTMHKGIRTKQYSFKECINCHVVKDENNQPVTHKSEKHFCNSCHSYASVQIDCFDCHASKPTPRKTTGKLSSMPNVHTGK